MRMWGGVLYCGIGGMYRQLASLNTKSASYEVKYWKFAVLPKCRQ